MQGRKQEQRVLISVSTIPQTDEKWRSVEEQGDSSGYLSGKGEKRRLT
jgi:hypothetical protein